MIHASTRERNHQGARGRGGRGSGRGIARRADRQKGGPAGACGRGRRRRGHARNEQGRGARALDHPGPAGSTERIHLQELLPREASQPARRPAAPALSRLRLTMVGASAQAGWRAGPGPRVAAAVLAGAALSLAFPGPNFGPVAFVALVPLLLAVENVRPRRAAALGYLAGFVFFGLLILWIPTDFLSWTGGVGWLAWLALCAAEACFVAAFAALVPATRRLGGWRVLLLPACWATLELLRAHAPLGGFPWGILGVSQHDGGPLLPLARVIGAYGLSAVIVAVNLALAAWLRSLAPRARARSWPARRELLPVIGWPALAVALVLVGLLAPAAPLFTPGGQLADRYRKRRLVPFGEYVPMASLMGRILPVTREGVPFDKIPGRRLEPMTVDGTRVGAIICWESTYPEDSRTLVREGAQVLLVSTNNASFGEGPASLQHLAASQLRAVEEGRTVVQAAVSGVSAVISPDGVASRRTGLYQQATLRIPVTPRDGLTLYARAGRLIEAAMIAIAVATALVTLLPWMRRRPAPAAPPPTQSSPEHAAIRGSQ